MHPGRCGSFPRAHISIWFIDCPGDCCEDWPLWVEKLLKKAVMPADSLFKNAKD